MRRGAFVLVLVCAMVVSGPAAAQSSSPFPDHEEVQTALDELSDHPWIEVETVGESVSGRSIRVAVVTDPNGTRPVEERPVTLVLTQQHGNEPAGTPAALDALQEIADGGPLAHTLSNQLVIVLPMANPDGAETGQRANAHGVDINRDHIALAEPESEAIHRVLTRWEVDVALDHHEYGGTGAGNPVPVRVYDYDLTTLYPVHGNVRTPTRSAAKALMYEGIWPKAREAGFTANEYGEVTAAGVPVQKISGGPDPGILRNQLGLHHVAGILVESRIDLHPNPFHDADRRIEIHRVVIDATLGYVHHHAQMFADARQAARSETKAHPHDRYVEGDRTGEIAEAYRVPEGEELRTKLSKHALETGVPDGNDRIVPTEQAMQGHVAAALHPASSRALVDAEAAEMPDRPQAPDPSAASATSPAVPGASAWATIVALAAGLVVLEAFRRKV